MSESDLPEVAILAYHKVGPPAPGGWTSWYYVSEEQLAGHIHWLHEYGWMPIDMARLLSGLDDPTQLPRRSALVTFDDGYRSTFERALPVLSERGCPGVVFVPTDYIGGVSSFDAGTSHSEEPICSWEDLHGLVRGGVAVQSHGCSHRAFSMLTPGEIFDEMMRSKRLLEDELGETVEMIAFPYGDPGTDTAALAIALERSGYRAACLYTGGPLTLPTGNRYRLSRIAMGPDTDLAMALETARQRPECW